MEIVEDSSSRTTSSSTSIAGGTSRSTIDHDNGDSIIKLIAAFREVKIKGGTNYEIYEAENQILWLAIKFNVEHKILSRRSFLKTFNIGSSRYEKVSTNLVGKPFMKERPGTKIDVRSLQNWTTFFDLLGVDKQSGRILDPAVKTYKELYPRYVKFCNSTTPSSHVISKSSFDKNRVLYYPNLYCDTRETFQHSASASNSSVSASASCSSVSGSSSTLALSSSTSASGSTLTGMGVGLVGAGLTAADQDVAGAAVGSDVALAIFQHSVSASNSSSVSTSSHNTSKKVRLNEESIAEAASAVEKPLSQKAKVAGFDSNALLAISYSSASSASTSCSSSGAVCCFANLSDDVRTQLVLKFQNLVGNNSSVSPKFQLQFQKGERGYKGLIQAIISCCGDRDALRNQLLSHCKYNYLLYGNSVGNLYNTVEPYGFCYYITEATSGLIALKERSIKDGAIKMTVESDRKQLIDFYRGGSYKKLIGEANYQVLEENLLRFKDKNGWSVMTDDELSKFDFLPVLFKIERACQEAEKGKSQCPKLFWGGVSSSAFTITDNNSVSLSLSYWRYESNKGFSILDVSRTTVRDPRSPDVFDLGSVINMYSSQIETSLHWVFSDSHYHRLPSIVNSENMTLWLNESVDELVDKVIVFATEYRHHFVVKTP